MDAFPPREQQGLWVHLAGEGPEVAVLAPANGFPPQIYQPMLRELLRAVPGLQVWGWVPRPMRTDRPPPQDLHWSDLAREYAGALARWPRPPRVGLGHSLGGVMTLMAWVMRPALFQGVLLMDPVIFEPRILRHIRRWQRAGAPVNSPFPLAALKAGALRRRRRFPSREAALAHFRTRAFFRSWDAEALRLYVTYGLRSGPDGAWELAYVPAWEAAIFAAVPTDIWWWIRRVPGPGWVCFGEFSEMGTPATRCLLERRWPRCRIQVLEGLGHMFPVEAPALTAHAVARALSHLFPTKGQ